MVLVRLVQRPLLAKLGLGSEPGLLLRLWLLLRLEGWVARLLLVRGLMLLRWWSELLLLLRRWLQHWVKLLPRPRRRAVLLLPRWWLVLRLGSAVHWPGVQPRLLIP